MINSTWTYYSAKPLLQSNYKCMYVHVDTRSIVQTFSTCKQILNVCRDHYYHTYVVITHGMIMAAFMIEEMCMYQMKISRLFMSECIYQSMHLSSHQNACK